jgi:hypothetical protein
LEVVTLELLGLSYETHSSPASFMQWLGGRPSAAPRIREVQKELEQALVDREKDKKYRIYVKNCVVCVKNCVVFVFACILFFGVVMQLYDRQPPTFSVRSGPCTTTADGACFRSSGYPGGEYGANEACDIAVAGTGFVKSTAFSTENDNDYVTIGETRYSGYSGDGGALLSCGGVAVSDGGEIAWRSDSSMQSSGFEVCGLPVAGSCDKLVAG